MTFKISPSNVVAYIVHPSLDVSGSLGILFVFSHGQGTLLITKEWDTQESVRMISVNFMDDLA